MNSDPRVSIIGSFRRYYAEVLDAIEIFESEGVRVLSPTRSRILDKSQEFVRFATDPPDCEDAEIQALAFERIWESDAVFVVAPRGYVGRTTCMEIGSLLREGPKVFYSEAPRDVPLKIGPDQVISPSELAAELLRRAE